MKSTSIACIVLYSGENAGMIETARQARARVVPVISLTMNSVNTIRSLADIVLLVPASERIYREGAATSRINQLTVVDILDASIAAIERTMREAHREKDKAKCPGEEPLSSARKRFPSPAPSFQKGATKPPLAGGQRESTLA